MYVKDIKIDLEHVMTIFYYTIIDSYACRSI